jgi:hypothetical protein
MRDVIKYSDYKRFGSTTKIIYDGQELPPGQANPNQANPSQPNPGSKPPAPQPKQ